MQSPVEHFEALGGASVNVVETVASLDQEPDLHIARILILLDAFAEEDGEGAIDGLTKLAKLDFLLRYPVMLHRALVAKNRPIRGVNLSPHELCSVESEMVRYRFGPWDHRYREYLNILVAKGLATTSTEGRKIVIYPTKLGRDTASTLAADELFTLYAERASILKRHFDLTATKLMDFIYETFPEIVSLRSDTRIQL